MSIMRITFLRGIEVEVELRAMAHGVRGERNVLSDGTHHLIVSTDLTLENRKANLLHEFIHIVEGELALDISEGDVLRLARHLFHLGVEVVPFAEFLQGEDVPDGKGG